MKVAILHYWFLLSGGGEQVIKSLLNVFPDADVYCLFASASALPAGQVMGSLNISFLNRIPFSHSLNRFLFPLYPAAVGAFDFSSYDLILTSDSPPTKAIIPSVDATHISYTHTPGRFIWDLSGQFGSDLPALVRPLFAKFAASARESDFIAAQRVDHFVANSQYVARRIAKYYRRESTVIYPPVDTSSAYIAPTTNDYYLAVGRLVENKRSDILIEACNVLRRRLLVVGTGRDEARLKAMAGPTIEFLGRVDDRELRQVYAECRALLFVADEDFGIVPVEAQAHGRPVIAYGRGGVLETVRVGDPDGLPDTGLFINEQSTEALIEGIREFELREHEFIPMEIRTHALQFDKGIFEFKMEHLVCEAMSAVRSSVLNNGFRYSLGSGHKPGKHTLETKGLFQLGSEHSQGQYG